LSDMEFKISSAELLKGVSDVSKAVPTKTALPILEKFLFVLKDGQLQITASDQELTLRTVVPVADVVEEGSIAVPARQISDLLKELPDQPITIKTTSDVSFECIWGNGNSTQPYDPAADYPDIKGVEEDALSVEFPSETLAEGLSSTVYATAEDEMRPAMNGVFFDLDTASTTLVASDSHKLICYTTKDAKVGEKASFILHKKPAGVLRSILDKNGDDVKVLFDANTIEFRFGSTTMICRKVVGKFPDYTKVIPQNNANILKIDRTMLLNTVKRVAVCASKGANHVKLDIREGCMEVTTQDLGFATAAYEKLECDYSGEAMSIGFKSPYLIEILSNMTCETIVFKLADPRRAALIVPSEEEEESEKVCGILMPVMIS